MTYNSVTGLRRLSGQLGGFVQQVIMALRTVRLLIPARAAAFRVVTAAPKVRTRGVPGFCPAWLHSDSQGQAILA